MTTHPSADTVERTRETARYLKDLFLHARERSRATQAAHDRLRKLLRQKKGKPCTPVALEARDVVQILDLLVDHENEVSDLLASIAEAGIQHARSVAATAAAIEDGRIMSEHVRPVFEESGRTDELDSEAA